MARHRCTIELRDLSTEKLKRLAELIRERAAEIASQTNISIEFTSINSSMPANAAVEVQRAIERAARRSAWAAADYRVVLVTMHR